jgi:predicted amidohydrolase YtcJ
MTSGEPITLRNVEVDGRPGLDVSLAGGRVAEIGPGLKTKGDAIDGRGGALIPGLTDHHIHLLATAAQADSLTLDEVRDVGDLARRLAAFAQARPRGDWIRATGYHHHAAGVLDREDIDRLAPDHPVRIEHQTGSLWMLNSRALELVASGDAPECVERDAAGRPTGRIWRGDDWLRSRIGRTLPALAPIGRRFASFGVTSFADASATTDRDAAALLAAAHRAGELPQRLMLMSAGPLSAPDDGAYRVGPVKILLDERDLLPFDEMTARIDAGRAQGRHTAVHCVTAVELALTLAAFEAAGARPGDRVEHGGVIPPEAIATIAELGLTVVTQPGFVFERGDRYLADVDPREQADLYRCASLIAAGVPVAASSDAPYTAPDPWAAMRVATRRLTRRGAPISPAERVSPQTALSLYHGALEAPGGGKRRVVAGAGADLCLMKAPIAEVLARLDADLVAMTFIAGLPVYGATDGAP